MIERSIGTGGLLNVCIFLWKALSIIEDLEISEIW